MESPLQFIMENHRKTKKNKNKNSLRTRYGFGSRLRVGKVLAPHNARPKTVTLIKWIKISMVFFKVLFFPNKITITTNNKSKQVYL